MDANGKNFMHTVGEERRMFLHSYSKENKNLSCDPLLQPQSESQRE